MRYLILCAIFALSVASVAKCSPPEQTPQTASHNEKGQPHKSNPQPTPALKSEQGIPFQAPTTEERNETIQSNSPEPDRWARIADWITAVATVALALIGAVAAWIALKTLEDIRTQTQSARISAEAAKKSADLAETTMRIVEAPDLCLDNAGLVPAGAVTPNSHVALRVKNFGGSRAKNVRSFIKLIIPGVPEGELSKETFSVGRGGSQLIRFLTFKEIVNPQIFQQIERGEIKVRFSGDITYEDVFEEKYVLNCRGVLDPQTGSFALGDKDPRGG